MKKLTFLQNKKNLACLIFLAIACFAIYGNTLKNDFVLDDYPLIVDNPNIKSLKFLPSFFSSDIYNYGGSGQTNYYRPILLASYSLDYAFWGLNPAGFHLTNILIHILNSLLVFLLLESAFSGKRLAFSTALLFCIHPIQTSAVGYISGRADLLSALFILSGLNFIWNYFKTCNLKYYLLTLIAAAAAIFSRENGIIFIFLAFLTTIELKVARKTRFFAFTGIALVVFFCLINRALITPAQLQTGTIPISPLPLHLELLNIINVLKEYSLLLLFPYPLYLMRTAPVVHTLSISIITFIAATFVLITISIKYRSSRLKFGLLWAAICLMPLFMTIYFSQTLGVMMAEHWLYLPSIGIFLILSSASIVLKKRQFLWLALLTLAYGVSTVYANTIWRDDIVLSRHLLKNSPDNGVAYLNLAVAHLRRGEYEQALKTLDALSSPEAGINWKIQNYLGLIYEGKKDFKKAEFHFKKAANIYPESYIPFFNLGNLYTELGKQDIALAYYKKALESNPSRKEVLIKTADCLQELGMYPQARRSLEIILAQKNLNLQELNCVASIYGNMLDLDTAIALWQEILKRDKYNMESLSNIQKALILKKNMR